MSDPRVPWPDDDIILYDGVCVLCSRWTRFVAARDPAGRFRFTPIESPYGSAMARAFGIDPHDPDTNAVIAGGKAFRRSDAALAVLGTLPGWRWTPALRIVPRPLRDVVYRVIARTRYRVFGRLDRCEIGGPLADRIVWDLPSGGEKAGANA